MNKPIQVK